MKKAMLLAAAMLVGSGAATFAIGQQAAPPAPTRSITKVAGDIYRFQNNNHFGLFMVTSQGAIVVDPINLDTANWLKGEIASRFNNAQVVQVLYSHHHWDHAAGAAAFPGAKVVSRVESAKSLAGPAAGAPLAAAQAGADANKDNLLQRAEATGANAQNFDAIDKDRNGGLSAGELYQYQHRDVVAPTETYSTPVKRITLGGKTVEMHHVSVKHADDFSYVYFPTEKILFVVDVISLKRLFFGAMPGYDEKDTFAAIDRAKAFNATYVVPGHGEMGANSDVEAVRTYLTELRGSVQAGIDRGQSLQQIQAELKLEKYAGWINYAEWRTQNIEGMYAFLKK